jgi:hypothetical protein
MKNIAFWSRDHKTTARLLTAVCHIIIFCAACYIGIGLKENNLSIPPLVFWIFAAIFILINIVFSKPYTSFAFYKKKLFDAIILVTCFIMIVGFANQKNIGSFTSYNTLQGSFLKKHAKVSEPTSKPSIREIKKQWKELRKLTKGEGASAGGIVLAILVAAILGSLVMAVSCSLACNGQNALAVFTILGGITAIFFICRLILRSTRNRIKDTPNVSSP